MSAKPLPPPMSCVNSCAMTPKQGSCFGKSEASSYSTQQIAEAQTTRALNGIAGSPIKRLSHQTTGRAIDQGEFSGKYIAHTELSGRYPMTSGPMAK